MSKQHLVTITLCLLAGPAALAQNADRTIAGVAQRDGQLEIKTNDGTYLIKPYSSAIVETSFVPDGESFDPASHAVVMAPAAVPATLKETNASIEYATAGIAVTITRAPFQIAYTYKGKQLIAEQHGYSKEADGASIDFKLDPDEALYGAGARAGGMNRRGYRFQLYNKAHYGYSTHSELMNFTMPLALSSKMYAIHFDNAQIGYLDFDSKKTNRLAYETIGGRKTYQVIAGDTWEDVVGNYTTLTGKEPMPPRWAFGNFASRFGYHSEEEARKTVAK